MGSVVPSVDGCYDVGVAILSEPFRESDGRGGGGGAPLPQTVGISCVFSILFVGFLSLGHGIVDEVYIFTAIQLFGIAKEFLE